MIKYNTQEKKLKLPEYGRNVQKMVEHCLTIEDRDERMRCAYKIADIMAMTFPNEVGEDGDKKKIWDHINIMADFKLDIDFPCEVIEKEDLDYNPHKVPYNEESLKYRHYG